MKDNEIELLKSAQAQDVNAFEQILMEYRHLVVAISRKYFLIGGDKEDLIQEGMIGLFKAVNSFDVTKNDNFSAYATILIEREISSCIKCFNSKKQQVLNSSIFIDDDDKFGKDNNCPESDIINEESTIELTKAIFKNLSPFETTVVDYYLKGYTYTDIAELTGKSAKSIDNALTRIKRKLEFLKEKL